MDVTGLLARQLQMTKSTWSLLHQTGVSEGEHRSVDYFFYAPSKQRANALATALREGGESPTVQSTKVGRFRKKTVWAINGQSTSLVMSEASLRAW